MNGRRLVAVVLCLLLAPRLSGDIRIGGERPTNVRVPATYDPEVPAPLVLCLHGLWQQPGSPGAVMESWWRFGPLSEELGFLLAYPEAIYGGGEWRWTFTGEDSDYIGALIEEAKSEDECGADPTGDELGCEGFRPCETP